MIKNKKIAIIIERKNSLEFFLPFIDKYLKKYTKKIIILVNCNKNKLKEYLTVSKKFLINLKRNETIFEYYSNTDLEAICYSEKINFICSFRSNSYFKLKNLKIKFILLQMNLDTFVLNDKTDFLNSDLIIIYSKYWLFFYQKVFGKKHFNNTKSKIIMFPSPKYQINYPTKDKIISKYNLNKNTKYLLVVPMNLKNVKSVWSTIFQINNKFLQILTLIIFKLLGLKITLQTKNLLKNSINEKKLIEAIFEFAKKNDLEIIIKGRSKSKVNKLWSELGAKVFYDESYYPSTISELIKCSEICITSYSTAIFDIINSELKTINIKKPSPYEDNFFKYNHKADILKFHNIIRLNENSPFLSSKDVECFDIDNFINNYEKIDLKKIGKNNKLDKYFYNGKK